MAENPKRKLFDALSEKEYYTKSFEDFDKQFSTNERVDKLYQALQDLDWDTGSIEDFRSQFAIPSVGKVEEVDVAGSMPTSEESVEPTQNTELQAEEQIPLGEGLSEQSSDIPDWAREFIPEGVEITRVGRDTVKYYDPEIESERQVIRPVDITNRQAENMTTERGFWGRTSLRLHSGLSDLGAGIASIPQLLYSLGTGAQNILANALENHGEKELADMIRVNPQEGFEQISSGKYNPLRLIAQVGDYYAERSEGFEGQLPEADADITGAISEGSYFEAGERLFGQIVRTGPTLLYLALTGGAGGAQNVGRMLSSTALKTLPFSANSYRDLSDAEGVDPALAPYYALMSGMVEILDAEIGASSILRNQIVGKKMGASEVGKMVTGYVEKALATNGIPSAMAKGAISEGIIRLSHNVVDKYSGKNPDQDLKDGILNSMIVGSSLSGVVSGASQAGNFVAEKSRRDRINKIESEIESILADLENAEGVKEDVLNQEVERKTAELNAELEQALENVDVSQAEKAVAINDSISDLNTLLQDDSISPETRTALESRVAELEEQVAGMVTTKEAISEVDATNQEVTAERDAYIDEYREQNPSTEIASVFDNAPESIGRTLDRLDGDLPVDPVAAKEASDYLYEKYKELSQMKKDPARMLKMDEINEQMEGLERDIEALERYTTEGEVVVQSQEADVAPVESEVATEEVTPTPTTVSPINEVRSDDAARSQARDEFIGKFRKANPSYEAETVFEDAPKIVEATLDRLDKGLPLDPVAVKETSDYLFEKYQELSDMKTDPHRMLTMDEINDQMSSLEADAEMLDSYSTDASEQIARVKQQESEVVQETPVEQTPVEQVDQAPIERTEQVPVEQAPPEQSPPEQVVERTVEEVAVEETPPEQEGIIDPVTGENLSELTDSEIAARYVEEYDQMTSLSAIEQAIVSLGGVGKVARESYARYSDRNRVGNSMARSYFSPEGRTVDKIAQDINNEVYNGEDIVTTQDIVDFMEKYPGGSETALRPSGNARLKALTSEMEGRRGRGINIRGARSLAEKYDQSQGKIEAAFNHDQLMSEIEILMNDEGEIDLGLLRNKVLEDPDFLVRESFFLTEQDVNNINKLLEYEAEQAEQTIQAEQSIGREQTESSRSTPKAETASKPVVQGKEVVKGVSDRVAKSGLAKSVKFSNSETIANELGVDGASVKGYVDSEGNIVINSDNATVDTPIHEMGHIWESEVAKSNPALHAKGMELIKGKEGKKYVDAVKKSQPHLKGDQIYKEALAEAIGDAGARIVSSKKSSDIKQWLSDVWKQVGKLMGISGMTPTEIQNLSLKSFSEAVAVDLLSGKKINLAPNGDVVMETSAKDVSQMTEQEKFKADFINKMRAKMGVKFQMDEASDMGQLSPSDMVSFVKFTEISLGDGTVSSLAELKAYANDMGITNQGQIELAYALARAIKAQGTIRIGSLSPDQLIGLDYDRLSDEAYIDLGKNLVDQGLINPESLIHDILENPRPLAPHEVTALVYRKSQVDGQMSQLLDSGKAIPADQFLFGLPAEMLEATGPDLLQMQLDILADYARSFAHVVSVTAHQQASAFRLRSLMTDKDYRMIEFIDVLKHRGELTPELEAKLKGLSDELTKVKSDLRKAYAEVDRLNKEAELGNLKEVAERVPRVRSTRTRTTSIEALNDVLDGLDFSEFGVSEMSFQADNVLRFSMQSNAELSQALTNAVAYIRAEVGSRKTSIPDAIEGAVKIVNDAVGKGNWNEIGFRSKIVNELVGKGETVSVKKPYVDGKGTLVVPSDYLRSVLTEMKDASKGEFAVTRKTVEDIVERVREEVGDGFDPEVIRQAVSGFGRNISTTQTELSTHVSQVKNLAKLLDRYEKLRQEGFAIKTSNDLHKKFEGAEQLREEIRMLEAAMPMTPEAWSQYNNQRNETRKKYLEGYIEQLNARIKNKDFAPANHVREYVRTDEVQQLEKRAADLRNKFKEEQFKWTLENRTRLEKVGDIIAGLWDITRMQAGLDGSALMVQGMLYATAKPKTALKEFGKSWGKSITLKDYADFVATLESDPWFESAKKGGLALQSQSIRTKVLEEQYGGDLFATLIDASVGKATEVAANSVGKDGKKAREKVNEYNPWAIAQREYDVFLSTIRLDLFKELMTSQITKAGVNPTTPPTKVLQEVADAVNMITAAAKPPFSDSKLGGQIISKIFYSAPKFWSTIKMFNPYSIGKMAVNNPQLFRDVYGVNLRGGFSAGYLPKALGRLTALTVIPTIISNSVWDSLTDEEKEKEDPPILYNPDVLNPTSADFLKLRTGPGGNRRISLFNGLDGHVVFLTRSHVQAKRQLFPTSDAKTQGWERKQVSHLAEDYVVNKFSPSASYLYNRFLRTDWHASQAMERTRVPNVNVPGLSFLAPMWVTGMFEDYDYSGDLTSTIGLGLLGALGLNYNTYGGAQFASNDGTNNQEVTRLFNRSGIEAPTPMFGRKIERPNGIESRMGWEEYNNSWKPAYEEYMTQASLAKKSELGVGRPLESKQKIVDRLKREAYKYADIKTQGIYVGPTYDKFSSDGVKYQLLKSQYPIKEKYIKEYFKRQARLDRRSAERDIIVGLRRDRKPVDREYVKMLAEIELQRRAGQYADSMLLRDAKRRKINLVKESDFHSGLENEVDLEE